VVARANDLASQANANRLGLHTLTRGGGGDA
jgi:hypothetical protein